MLQPRDSSLICRPVSHPLALILRRPFFDHFNAPRRLLFLKLVIVWGFVQKKSPFPHPLPPPPLVLLVLVLGSCHRQYIEIFYLLYRSLFVAHSTLYVRDTLAVSALFSSTWDVRGWTRLHKFPSSSILSIHVHLV